MLLVSQHPPLPFHFKQNRHRLKRLYRGCALNKGKGEWKHVCLFVSTLPPLSARGIHGKQWADDSGWEWHVSPLCDRVSFQILSYVRAGPFTNRLCSLKLSSQRNLGSFPQLCFQRHLILFVSFKSQKDWKLICRLTFPSFHCILRIVL